MTVKCKRKWKKWLSLSFTAVFMVSVLMQPADAVLASEIPEEPKGTEYVDDTAENEETETAVTKDPETGEDAPGKDGSETGEDAPGRDDSEAAKVPDVSGNGAGEEEQKKNAEDNTEGTEDNAGDAEKGKEQDENKDEDVLANREILPDEGEGEPVPYADDIIASGTSGSITWTLDADGKLTVSGSGDFTSSLWNSYRESVTSVEVNVTGLTSTNRMFYGCNSLESVDLSGSDTGNVTDMSWMFYGCSNLTDVNLSGIDTGNVTDMSAMFDGCSGLTSLDVSGFNTGNVTNMAIMFSDCSSLTSLDVSSFDTRNVTHMANMFSGCSSLAGLNLSNFNTRNVTFTYSMFYGCSSLTSLDLSSFDTQVVNNMRYMFSGCSNLTSLDLSSFDTRNVTDMSGMFDSCRNLTSLDLSSFNTGNVSNMEALFNRCNSLASLDLSSFNTGNVTNMGGMFVGCNSLINLDLSSFDTRNVSDMNGMFYDCNNLVNLDLSSFDTGNVVKMNAMFHDCNSLEHLDLSSFNTGNVENMIFMFKGCSNLTELDLSKFDMHSVDTVDDMLFGCDKLTTINTPLNLTQSVETPVVAGAVWRLPDGTEITELPQNLGYSVVVTRHINPKIITTTTELNMEDVVRVKYVPYSYTVRTDNVDEENRVTFSLESGELPRGMEIYPATGEIYGVPMEAGEFPITVKASYSNPEYEPSYADLTVIVKENTDGDVYNASDAGYDLIVPVGERAEDGSNVFVLKQSGDQLFVSAGEFREFIALWLNGERLVDGVDYTKESGSTRITIRAQTFENKADQRGTNTLAMEFRVDGDERKELRRTAQNFRMDSSQNNSGDDVNNSGKENENESNPGSGNGGGDNSGNKNNNRDDISDKTIDIVVDPGEETVDEIITYTVVSGDTLWKIARMFYGSGTYWQKIYADNAAVIRDPNRIYAGQVLTIYLSRKDESIITGPDATDIGEGYYTVKKGDTLWDISEKVYGRGKNWRKIYDANRDKIKKPDCLYAGQVLEIPGN